MAARVKQQTLGMVVNGRELFANKFVSSGVNMASLTPILTGVGKAP